MNEDAAFIAAIVTNPGEDTSRLVYADWLEERDDPRAAYLRAEVEWTKSRNAKDEARARTLAESLDAVWVARVSHPPLGVCCGHVSFDHDYDFEVKPVTSTELDQLEKRFGLTLPSDYRAFLLNYNGGAPKPNRLRVPDYKSDVSVTTLTGVYSRVDPCPPRQCPGLDWEIDLVRCLLFLEWCRNSKRRGLDDTAAYWQADPLREQIIVGYSGITGLYEIYCLGVRGASFGKVFYAASGPGPLDEYANCIPVADSFAAFLGMLTDHRKRKKPARQKPKKS